MDMSLDFNALGALFELSQDAVIGLENNQICFANPKALSVFSIESATKPSDFIPADILDTAAESFVTRRSIRDKSYIVSVRRFDKKTLICFILQDISDTPGALSPSFKTIRAMSESLMELRIALDAVMRHCRQETKKEVKGYAAVLYRDYFRLQRLCSHLSTAANLADGRLPYSPQVIDLRRVITELCDSLDSFSGKFTASVECHIEKGYYFTYADENLIDTMLLNLITNSLLHSERDTPVRVSLQQTGTRFLLSVDDQGSGMSAEDMLHAFDEKSGSKMSERGAGAGLGLLIAQGVAEMHGGSVILESHPDGGCHVRVSLPQRDAPFIEFHSPPPAYLTNKTNLLFTELSVVLPNSCFEERFLD